MPKGLETTRTIGIFVLAPLTTAAGGVDTAMYLPKLPSSPRRVRPRCTHSEPTKSNTLKMPISGSASTRTRPFALRVGNAAPDPTERTGSVGLPTERCLVKHGWIPSTSSHQLEQSHYHRASGRELDHSTGPHC